MKFKGGLKMIKKKLLGLALSSMMALSLAACGGSSGGADKSSAAADSSQGSADGGKITVAIWDNGQKPGLQEIINDFTAETGYQVDLQVITWDSYWTLLEAGASGGDMPDVFWMHSNESQKYMENGILMDLTERIKASDKLEMDKFPEDVKELYVNDGKTYAIP